MSKKIVLVFVLLVVFVFVQGVSAEESVNIIFGEPEYNQGDNVQVTLFAESDRGVTIKEFYVEAEYEQPGINYVDGLDGTYFSAVGNSASFSFRAARANTMVSVKVWAFNGVHDSGGIPVAMETSQVFINDPVPGSITDNSGNDEVDTSGFELVSFLVCALIMMSYLYGKRHKKE